MSGSTPTANGSAPTSTSSAFADPLAVWLMGESGAVAEPSDFLSGFAERLLATGLVVRRMRVFIRTLHSQVMGICYAWDGAASRTEAEALPHTHSETVPFCDRSIAVVLEHGETIRRRLDVLDTILDLPVLDELGSQGFTDYLALPLRFSNGRNNALTLATDRPGGFRDDDVSRLNDLLPVLALVLKVHEARHTAQALLETYLGQHTGKQLLDGLVKRGDGDNIYAVIWFCDLRDSTVLPETLPRQDFLGSLNAFFDCMAGAVMDHDGEVLRFVGDAALAIFPIGSSSRLLEDVRTPEEGACSRALAVARDARARMATLNS